MFYYTFISDIGEITVIADENYIKAVHFGKSEYVNKKNSADFRSCKSASGIFQGRQKSFYSTFKAGRY